MGELMIQPSEAVSVCMCDWGLVYMSVSYKPVKLGALPAIHILTAMSMNSRLSSLAAIIH